MIDFFHSIVLGLIQGITEFFPISSSGHLLIYHEMFGTLKNSLKLDAMLHLATALALLVSFRKDWIQMIKERSYLLKLVVLGSVPAVVMGLLFKDVIENSLRSPWVVVVMLVGVAVLMWEVDRTSGNGEKKLTQLSLGTALFIGGMQAIALIPGTSRAGITLIAGLMVGLSRRQAVRYAFLLGMPVTLGAGLLQIPELMGTNYSVVSLLVSFGVAFTTGIIAIKWLLNFVAGHSLISFVIYRFILAGVVVLYLLS